MVESSKTKSEPWQCRHRELVLGTGAITGMASESRSPGPSSLLLSMMIFLSSASSFTDEGVSYKYRHINRDRL